MHNIRSEAPGLTSKSPERRIPQVLGICGFIAALAFTLLTPTQLRAQTARIEGTVRNAESRDPLPGARITVVGTDFLGVTNENGYYAIETVPVGTYDVQVRIIGYRSVILTNQRVTAGTPTTIDFELLPSILRLEGIVVTGVAEATQAVKLPFTVEQVSGDELPVPAQTAEEAIRGKVAGARVVRGDGRPGNEVNVVLRGITSIDVTGRANEPLYVVDGVILGASMVDVDALDIENIEVVKGAAAAALYGARAANGVISIQTRRGTDLPEGETRITVRTEVGRNSLQGSIPRPGHHYFLQDTTGAWIDAAGTVLLPDTTFNPDGTIEVVTPREKRVPDWVRDSTLLLPGTDPGCTPDPDESDCFTKWRYAIADNPFTGPTFDHLDQLFDPGTFTTNSLTLAHRSGSTTLRASLHESKETGIVEGIGGYVRRGARVNVGHSIGRTFDFRASTYYAQSVSDDPFDGANNPFYRLAFVAPDVKLDTLPESPRDSADFLALPGSFNNPLYLARNADMERRRVRTLGSFALRWRPLTWFDVEGDFSYDRSDRNETEHYFKGFGSLPSGSLEKRNAFNQAINASLSATVTRSLGDLATVFKGRVLMERNKGESFGAAAPSLVVTGAKDLDQGDPDEVRVTGSSSDVRSLGYFLSTQLDYKDKLITDVLLRRDGSSLFGADERWHTYYRVSGAYRISEEPFWPFGFLDEFKLRYSIGTAGGRPQFEAQYETFDLTAGTIAKRNLGNRDLKPERATEHEFGVDLMALGRVTLSLTHVRSTVDDQILLVPLIDFYGFDNQWRNAGELSTRAWEGTLQASLIETPGFSWNLNLVVDRIRQKVTRLDVPEFAFGSFLYRAGEDIGSIYGARIATKCDDILTAGGLGVQSACDAFDVNDDGYLVPVGAGNRFTDGIDKNLYGSKVTIDGIEYDWGLPVASHEVRVRKLADGSVVTDTTDLLKVGNTQSDFNFALGSTVRWKALSVYTLFDAQVGGNIYNWTLQWPLRDLVAAAEVDQSEKQPNHRKPIDYYSRLYAGLYYATNSHHVEDGTYLKFRELAVRYTFGRRHLQRLLGGFVKRVSLSLIGRNLHTWTSYSGYDPEVSSERQAALFRWDAFGYPNYRTWTGSVEIEF